MWIVKVERRMGRDSHPYNAQTAEHPGQRARHRNLVEMRNIAENSYLEWRSLAPITTSADLQGTLLAYGSTKECDMKKPPERRWREVKKEDTKRFRWR